MTDNTRTDKKPGEKPTGKFHYNPGNMAGKAATTRPDMSPDEDKTQRTPANRRPRAFGAGSSRRDGKT